MKITILEQKCTCGAADCGRNLPVEVRIAPENGSLREMAAICRIAIRLRAMPDANVQSRSGISKLSMTLRTYTATGVRVRWRILCLLGWPSTKTLTVSSRSAAEAAQECRTRFPDFSWHVRIAEGR